MQKFTDSKHVWYDGRVNWQNVTAHWGSTYFTNSNYNYSPDNVNRGIFTLRFKCLICGRSPVKMFKYC